jgi:hypothetical protein
MLRLSDIFIKCSAPAPLDIVGAGACSRIALTLFCELQSSRHISRIRQSVR